MPNPVLWRRLAFAGPLDPAGVAGMQLRLDAAALTGFAINDPITTWPDTSGHGRNAISTGVGVVPKYIRTATRPDGGNQGMAWFNPFDGAGSECGGSFPKSAADDTQGFTYYFWFRSFDATNGQVLFQDDTSSRPVLRWLSAGGKIGWGDASGTPHDFTAPTTGYHSLIYRFNPPNGTGLGQVLLDGVSLGTAVWSWNTTIPTSYLVGDNAVSTANWDGWLAELIVYSGAHSEQTWRGVQAFLRGKWGWG
jgi:hypothetical protein